MDEWRFDESDANQPPALTTLGSGDVRHEFMTWLGPGVLQPKLENFIHGGGEALEADEKRIRIRFGKPSRFSWHRHEKDFPVEVTITLHRETPCARGMTHVVADMHPVGKNVPHDLLEARCSRLARDLRYCFFGQDLQIATKHAPKPRHGTPFSVRQSG